MILIKNLKINLVNLEKEILHGVNLTINPGEVHLLNGRNGSGKSTLVSAIMGNPNLKVTNGTIELVNEEVSENILNVIQNDDPNLITNDQKPNAKKKELNLKFKIQNLKTLTTDITNYESNIRSLLGIYLANQYPVEVPGVSLMQYLRLIYNIRQSKENKLPVFKFKQLVLEKAALIKYPESLLKRNLNEGFSGGEKKKTEILQMLILNPKYILLDEIDSGLDKQSIVDVFTGLRNYHELNISSSFLIISHYDKVLEYLKPNFIHEMDSGNLVR